ncbi:MAG: hypothetical protein K2G70_06010 [Turicibacter sp.]|nr:hypothetical protein [Turicibacter sp.]
MSKESQEEIKIFTCENCGANMVFDIKSQALKCPYCNTEKELIAEGKVQEYDFSTIRPSSEKASWSHDVEIMSCKNCGAEIVIDSHTTALHCSYCGSSNILKTKQSAGIKPEAILPFKIEKQQAMEELSKWMKYRWLAPNNLKNLYQSDKLQGIYIPYWTYDAMTSSRYRAYGGRYHYEMREINGKKERIQKVHWHPVSGHLHHFFDDVLINASHHYTDTLMNKVEPFNTDRLIPYRSEYLSGYMAEHYSLGVQEGFSMAKHKMEHTLEETARFEILQHYDTVRDIRLQTCYDQMTFKHVLLPIWTANYQYNGKDYRYIINGETGRIHGTYPYSWVKITLLTLLGMILIYFIFIYFNY